MLSVYKKLGRFEHPLQTMEAYGLDPAHSETVRILKEITNPKPNVSIELLREERREATQILLAQSQVLQTIDQEFEKIAIHN
jgi:hypothetical protein